MARTEGVLHLFRPETEPLRYSHIMREEHIVSTRRLEEEVQRISREVSFNYVVEPSIKAIRDDALVGLKRYTNAVRSKARQIERNKSKLIQLQPEVDPTADPDGLDTKLRPTNGCGLDDNSPVSKEVEAYLHEVQYEILNHIDKMATTDTRKTNNITDNINSLFTKLKKRDDLVVVPTDKTNAVRIMKTDKYCNQVTTLLTKEAVPTTYAHLQEVKLEADNMLASVADILSQQEYNYIKSTISKHSVPTVQLLVKDHKDKDEHGDYPTRVPAKNFTAGFPHVGQRGIKAILDRNKINYSKKLSYKHQI